MDGGPLHPRVRVPNRVRMRDRCFIELPDRVNHGEGGGRTKSFLTFKKKFERDFLFSRERKMTISTLHHAMVFWAVA